MHIYAIVFKDQYTLANAGLPRLSKNRAKGIVLHYHFPNRQPHCPQPPHCYHKAWGVFYIQKNPALIIFYLVVPCRFFIHLFWKESSMLRGILLALVVANMILAYKAPTVETRTGFSARLFYDFSNQKPEKAPVLVFHEEALLQRGPERWWAYLARYRSARTTRHENIYPTIRIIKIHNASLRRVCYVKLT